MKNLFIIISILFLFSVTPVFSHSGRTNSSGCHNCRTGSCAGTYHCHNGGSSSGSSGGSYGNSGIGNYNHLLVPEKVADGDVKYETSKQGWCNYDVSVTWDRPLMATKYSIAASKYAGADPGPLTDTSNTSYTFKSLEKGIWYINIKAGNAYGWSPVTYWIVALPEMPKSMNSQIIERDGTKYLNYSISCMDKVEGPQEFIDYLESNNYPPTGEVLLSYTGPTAITMKGYDKAGDVYEQTLDYTPVTAGITDTTDTTNSDDDSSDSILGFGVVVVFSIYIFNKIWQWIAKAFKKQ